MVFVYFENDAGTTKGLVKLKDDKELVEYVKANPTLNVTPIYGDDVNLDQLMVARQWGFVNEFPVSKTSAEGIKMFKEV